MLADQEILALIAPLGKLIVQQGHGKKSAANSKWPSLASGVIRPSISWGQFHQCSTRSFYTGRSQKRKKDSKIKQLYWAFGICLRKKLLVEC